MKPAFAQAILHWYTQNRRELPWRDIDDPYRIWVSEIILQQTRVVQGFDYYQRFIKAFPSVEALAAASEDEVLHVWQGLGYYSRARNMREAARQIIQNGGDFPQEYKDVRALKGVGDYTAAAICSFAYGAHHAVVDGNVYRVLSRYFGIEEPIDTTKGKKVFAALAQDLVPEGHSADYNQGLMDFGAIQCVPQSPACLLCPLADSCHAHLTGKVEDFPIKIHRTKITERYFVYVCVETPEGLWIHKRATSGIWKGLYEFPLLEFNSPANLDEIRHHAFFGCLSGRETWKLEQKDLRHVLTHRIIHADVYSLTCASAIPLPDGFIAVSPKELTQYPMPKLVQNVANKLKWL